MIKVRRFSPDVKTKIPNGHPGVFAVPIQLDKQEFAGVSEEKLARKFNGLPLLLNSPTSVVAMYFDPHGSMDEHDNPDNNILFLVIRGRGFVRVGGPKGETRAITAGDAILWPANVDHTVWTEDDPLDALVIEMPA